MVHLEKKAEEQKKFEGMDNLLKKKKKGKRNKSKILEMSAQWVSDICMMYIDKLIN